MFCLYTLPLDRPAHAKVQMLTTSSCIVKLIPWNLVNLSHLYLKYFTSTSTEMKMKTHRQNWVNQQFLRQISHENGWFENVLAFLQYGTFCQLLRRNKERLLLKGIMKIESISCIFALTDRLGGKEAWRPTHFSIYQTFFCIFQTNFAMATLGLKEMGKFLNT